MLFIIMIISAIAILSLIGMVVLLALKLIFWILRMAGKATFSIAKFGFKLSGLAIIFVIALVFCSLLGII